MTTGSRRPERPGVRFSVLPLPGFITCCCLIGSIFVNKVAAFSSMGTDHYVGFDLGTSGSRMSIIQSETSPSGGQPLYREVYSDAIAWSDDGPYDDAKAWTDAVFTLLGRAKNTGLLASVRSICASGTSASCLLIDSLDGGKATRKPRMYDFDIMSSVPEKVHAVRAMDLLDKYAPPRHTARARTGSLAKLLAWHQESPLKPGEVLCHQSDFVALNLMHDPKKCGSGPAAKRTVTSDWHNTLKLGFDVQNLKWPDWLASCLEEGAGISNPIDSGVVPKKVVSPGEPIGTISQHLADEFGISPDAVIVGGTTDSNAAFFAAVGGTAPDFGTAVTSLGSTLAMKMLSETFVEDADRGVYSHRFPVFGEGCAKEEDSEGEAWLIGGASNSGCAVLRQQNFSNEELVELSKDIDPTKDSPLAYYPLTKKGERFPTADGEMVPVLEPVPESRTEYLHGILQGISDVEREGFRVLGELGASPSMPRIVWSCGGGAKNDMWLKMRERRIGDMCKDDSTNVLVRRADNTEASFGAAILAAATFS